MSDSSPIESDFDQALRAVVITDVQISPDGSQVLYTTSRASTEREQPSRGTLWLAEVESGRSRRLTTADAGHARPRWSPDGRRLAFLSDRGQRGVAQIYLLNLDLVGEAVRLTDHPTGVRCLEWSPDGRSLAFTGDASPPGGDDGPDARVMEHRHPPTALWLLTIPEDDTTFPGEELPAYHPLSPPGLHVGGRHDYGGPASHFHWAPDSKSVVILAARSANFGDLLDSEVITVSTTGQVRSVVRVQGLGGGTPRFSPDGSTIAFNGAVGTLAALFCLQTVPLAGGVPRVLVPDHEGSFYDYPSGSFAWLPDGERILGVILEGQQQRLVVVNLNDDGLEDAVVAFDRPGAITHFSVSADGRRVAFVRGDDTSYGDVYVADLSGRARRLSDTNPWTRDVRFGEVRDISWTSFDGLEIHGLLVLPVGYDEGRRYPALLQIHGGPMSAWMHLLHADAVWSWGQFMAQRGYVVIQPNPRGSAGRGRDFLCGIVDGKPDWRDLMSGVDKVVELGIADPDRMVVGGYSYGGYLTNWTITHTDRFKAAVSLAGPSFTFASLGVVDDDLDKLWRDSPVRYINAARTPTLLLHGERDEISPAHAREMYDGLTARGVETSFVVYAREGHVPTERVHQLDILDRVIRWFDEHLR